MMVSLSPGIALPLHCHNIERFMLEPLHRYENRFSEAISFPSSLNMLQPRYLLTMCPLFQLTFSAGDNLVEMGRLLPALIRSFDVPDWAKISIPADLDGRTGELVLNLGRESRLRVLAMDPDSRSRSS
jgi:hypothetical protein